jgi:hypothetical protein
MKFAEKIGIIILLLPLQAGFLLPQFRIQTTTTQKRTKPPQLALFPRFSHISNSKTSCISKEEKEKKKTNLFCRNNSNVLR